MAFCIFLAVVYFCITGPFRKYFSESARVPVHQKVYFTIALLMLLIAKASPLHAAAHYMFSMHMLGMAFEYLAFPPLLLASLPAWLVRPVTKLRLFRKGIAFFLRPMIALVAFNFLFSFYHLPYIFDTLMHGVFLHIVYELALVFTAFCMWWVVVCPVPEHDTLSDLKKMGYIFANGVLLTPACALIMFADGLLYHMYHHTPQLITFLDPLRDQQLGGVLMKVFQEIIYIGAIGYIFYHWIKHSRTDEEQDPYETSERARLAFQHDTKGEV